MKRKAKVANVIANASNGLIHWRPFNVKPIRGLYDWANRVRTNDPAWIEFLKSQDGIAALPSGIILEDAPVE